MIRVDVDRRYGKPLRFAEIVARLVRARYRLCWLAQRRSPSGRGWHLWLKLSPAPRTAVEIVALQLLLGSDPRRESYCLNRARAHDAGDGPRRQDGRLLSWNVLYRALPRYH